MIPFSQGAHDLYWVRWSEHASTSGLSQSPAPLQAVPQAIHVRFWCFLSLTDASGLEYTSSYSNSSRCWCERVGQSDCDIFWWRLSSLGGNLWWTLYISAGWATAFHAVQFLNIFIGTVMYTWIEKAVLSPPWREFLLPGTPAFGLLHFPRICHPNL